MHRSASVAVLSLANDGMMTLNTEFHTVVAELMTVADPTRSTCGDALKILGKPEVLVGEPSLLFC
jgi:hypothetical protein